MRIAEFFVVKMLAGYPPFIRRSTRTPQLECPKGINIISRRWNLRRNGPFLVFAPTLEGRIQPLRGWLFLVAGVFRRFHLRI